MSRGDRSEDAGAASRGGAAALVLGPDEESATLGSFLGLPYDGGVPNRPGARFGPAALRRALATFAIDDGNGEVGRLRDLGDLSLPTMNGQEAHARIEEAARDHFRSAGIGVFIGGDHGCTGSIIRGLAAARPDIRLGIVSIDAHLDVREYADAAHLSSGTPFRRALESGIVIGENVAMIGIRPFANSRTYIEWARDQGVSIFGSEEVARLDPEGVARNALAAVGEVDALYLSVDLDAADSAFAPGVSAIGTGGLTSREMIGLVRAVASHPQLVGFDIMELAPPYDQDDRTARLAARLLLEMLRVRRG